ncbi:MAG: GNAT family N-acetyltransferase [Solirubrobacteraceae bacterium]
MLSFPDIDAALSGPGARLRLAAERDIPEILIAHQDDSRLHAVLGLERPPSSAELGRRIEREAADRAAGVGVWLTILPPGPSESDECCGQVYVHDVDPDHLRAELGIWVVAARRGAGLGTAALNLAGRWLLMVCGLMRVELLSEPDNDALTRAATAAGFSVEGVLRAYVRAGRGAGRAAGRGARNRADVRVVSLIPADLVAP